ncbi:DUF2642 domain-containing protein [Cytobacillus sp. Hz8]|uniref:DUF2642 domain-containing protein n=1 Tax=Cytobacillus sp. Hz8 TaxID=3347168 RepID=UPI0035D8C2E1
MSKVKNYIGKQIFVQISGKDSFNGILTDIGSDVMVIFNGDDYLYLPFNSIHLIQLNTNDEEQVNQPSESTFLSHTELLSLDHVLTNAKGTFTEIFVTGKTSYFGYILNISQDYFTFYSPIYKFMFISIEHLKWLIPHSKNQSPFTLSNEKIKGLDLTAIQADSIEEQLKRKIGHVILIDGGNNPQKSGMLNDIKDHLVELTLENGEVVYWNLAHIKSVHLV